VQTSLPLVTMLATLSATALVLLLSTPACTAFSSLSTFSEDPGIPISSCGVLPAKLKDSNGKALPYITLNQASAYSGGKNCGRWIEITIGNNCVGGSNTDSAVCIAGSVSLFSF
jgi:hypothetical protein